MAALLLLEMLLWKRFSGLRIEKTSLTGRTENFVLVRIRVDCSSMEEGVLFEEVRKISWFYIQMQVI